MTKKKGILYTFLHLTLVLLLKSYVICHVYGLAFLYLYL